MNLLDTTLGFNADDISRSRIKRLAIKALNIETAISVLTGYEPQYRTILAELETERAYYEKRLEHIAAIVGDDVVNDIRIDVQ